MTDSFAREIDYLRVSVTDRCNFRCVYCMPEEGAEVARQADILDRNEITQLVGIASNLGIRKVRLTGGEPLVRKDICEIVSDISSIHGIVDLALTTNGMLLERWAHKLVDAGLMRVNISLDTLRQHRFEAIARRGNLDTVWRSIHAALDAGLEPVKINVVVMRGVNDDEAAQFAELTVDQPLHVRFIEIMPINWSNGGESLSNYYALASSKDNHANGASHNHSIGRNTAALFHKQTDPAVYRVVHGMLDGSQMRSLFVSSQETKAQIEADFGALEPAELPTNGPSATYRIPGAAGTVGFISQITNNMCARCNRMRLTADGFLRSCLMADGEVDLRMPLRTGSSDEDIAELFRQAVRHKPKEHRLEDGIAPHGRNMNRLGG